MSYDPFGPRDPFELLAISLTANEREVLAYGLISWGGPARCTDPLAFAMGFGTYDELLAETARLLPVIRRGDAMSRFDWRRTLFATEIAFASDVMGAGRDWCPVSGFGDAETIHMLRQIQQKIIGA